jgi:hypothetical protein
MSILKSGLYGLLCALMSMYGPTALAATPDGQTPALEPVCEPLKAEGITKGLYGLCVAYCEAQDYASRDVPITEAELDTLAAEVPKSHILASYNRKKKPTDPGMPCIVDAVDEPCHCWTTAELIEVSDGVSPDFVGISNGCDVGNHLMQVFERGPPNSWAALISMTSGQAFCSYSNSATAETASIPVETDEQYSGCKKQLMSRCDEVRF